MLIIENISGVELDINDLGLTLQPSETIDLTFEGDAKDVSASAATGGDLNALISSNNIAVKDPLDGATNLSNVNAIAAVRSHNDSHYRMPVGGRIADAVDVDVTGITNNNFLVFNTTNNVFEPLTPSAVSNIIGGHNAWEIIDTDGDTSISVDNANGDDIDLIEAKVANVVKLQIFPTRLSIKDTLNLAAYPETRDDGDTKSALYVNEIGDVEYGAVVLELNDLSDVDTTGIATGDMLLWKDTQWEPSGLVRIGENSCSIATIDETGLDWCNYQIGTNGSAFMSMKKSEGSIAAPLPVTDGTKVGGLGFIGDDAVTPAQGSPGYVGAQVSSFVIGDQTATNGGHSLEFQVTAQDAKTRTTVFETDAAANVVFPEYPNTRNDGTTSNALFVDAAGTLQHGPVVPSIRPTFCIFAEENSDIGVSMNNYEFSFGNGATNSDLIPSGIPMGVACTLIAITISANQSGTDASSFSISVVNNGTVVATSGIASSTIQNQEAKIATQITPDTVNFAVGDTLQFLTASATGVFRDVRVSAWFERTA